MRKKLDDVEMVEDSTNERSDETDQEKEMEKDVMLLEDEEKEEEVEGKRMRK